MLKQLHVSQVFVCQWPAAYCRQQKSRQLIDLQSELQLLESDIKQVASRQLDSTDASQHGQAHQQLPLRQPSTQLLQKRLQEAISTASVAAKQSADRSKASEAEGQSRPSLPAQPAPAVHVRPSAMLAPHAQSAAAQQASGAPAQRQPAPAGVALLSASPAAAVSAQHASGQPGIILAQPGNPQLPAFPSSSQLSETSHHQLAAALDAARSLEPQLSRASNGYLMIAHPYQPPLAPPQQQPPATAAGPSSAAPGTLTSAAAAATASAPAASSAVPPVPLPTQMDRQHSMHIHPRHLAFQHFHQQQAALQQRQQPTGQGLGGVGTGAATAASGPLRDPPSPAATQEAAVRCVDSTNQSRACA